MLSRILEPEVMDTLAEAVDYNSMDHSEVNRRFVDDFLSAWGSAERPAGDILDLGTGTALIPIELCRSDPALHVTAVDLAEHMLTIAGRNVIDSGLTDRIKLERVDAKRLSYPDGHFAVVMSNSIVHHIPEPHTVLAEAVRVTARSGLIFVRDLMRPPDGNALESLVAQYAGAANDHQQAMFAASLHAALTLEEIQELVAGLGFPGESVEATSDRHWTWST